ncbi:hypothetical protein DQ04_00341140 [Trypanosoma grayi]|uniref:hypothetical protein n=1 Tax=Trypanosoma grayi TaxID=71804 RepID=UPI0004F47EA5|nr:hypothetical protein DQ04_00341140 [Trypanosoma grayi]KEG14699.1 hypothetical protein DQ04_00341140 [Trypanosoma grayi]
MAVPAAAAAVAAAPSSSDARGSVPPGPAAFGTKRLFNLLEDESKERVLRMLTSFRTLTPLEQAAAAQELGVTLPKEEKQGALVSRSLTGPALDVRSRDRSYVALADPQTRNVPRSLCAPSPAEAELAVLAKPLLTGTPLLGVPAEGSAEGTASVPQKGNCRFRAEVCDDSSDTHSQQLSAAEGADADEVAPPPQEKEKEAQQLPLLFRSRGYQALRLARDDEPNIMPEKAYTTPSVLNLTGMPIEESDLWTWFETLDAAGTGVIGVEPLMSAIKDLDRGFGVSQTAEAEFRDEVEALATDGQLTFEKFAFVVSRFPRQ